MPAVRANVPEDHLATSIAEPNAVKASYTSQVLLPLRGPVVLSRAVRTFERHIAALTFFRKFFETAKHDAAPRRIVRQPAIAPAAASGPVQLKSTAPSQATPGITHAEKTAPPIVVKEGDIFAQAMDIGIIDSDGRPREDISAEEVWRRFIGKVVEKRFPSGIPDNKALVDWVGGVVEGMKKRGTDVVPLPKDESDRKKLALWLLSEYLADEPRGLGFEAIDLKDAVGFVIRRAHKEWAIYREEETELKLGAPRLVGPLGTKPPVTAQGKVTWEEYSATRNELALVTLRKSGTDETELSLFGSGSLERALSALQYDGNEDLSRLLSTGPDVLQTDRSTALHAWARNTSRSLESMRTTKIEAGTSSRTMGEIPGVDPKLSITPYVFKVIVPATATTRWVGVGLTWCPYLENPFASLRETVERVYAGAVATFKQMYHVTEPTKRAVKMQTVRVSCQLNVDNKKPKSYPFVLDYRDSFNRDLDPHPDLSSLAVTYVQNESFWRQDADAVMFAFKDLEIHDGMLTGNLYVETVDSDRFDAIVEISVQVTRKDEADAREVDSEFLKAQADYMAEQSRLSAQAHQFALIKRREFIDSFERGAAIENVVFDATIRAACRQPGLEPMFREMVSSCIDWSRAKCRWNPANLDQMPYPEYGPHHFLNATGARLFLPVKRDAEDAFVNIMSEYTYPHCRRSVQTALDYVKDKRVALKEEPVVLSTEEIELTIGEHIESVLSDHEQQL